MVKLPVAPLPPTARAPPLAHRQVGGKAGSACTWRVVAVDKIVARECHAKVFGEVVQASGDDMITIEKDEAVYIWWESRWTRNAKLDRLEATVGERFAELAAKLQKLSDDPEAQARLRAQVLEALEDVPADAGDRVGALASQVEAEVHALVVVSDWMHSFVPLSFTVHDLPPLGRVPRIDTHALEYCLD